MELEKMSNVDLFDKLVNTLVNDRTGKQIQALNAMADEILRRMSE